MKKYLLMFSAMSCFLTTPSEAQVAENQFDPYMAVPFFNAQMIAPSLRAAGAKAIAGQSPTGETYLQVEATNGLKFNILFAACEEENEKNCKGMSMSALWDKPASTDTPQVQESIRKFNEKYNFIKAGILSDGRPFVQRYTIADYGTVQGNIRSEIETFTMIASLFNSEALGIS